MEGLTEMMAAARGLLAGVQESTTGVEPGELMSDIRELQRVISAVSAVQTVRIGQYAARDEERTPDGVWVAVDRGIGHVCEFAGDDLAPVLGMAPSMATTRVHTAAALAAHLPVTLRAVADGDLDPFRAQLIAEETLLADHDTRAAVEEAIYPQATQATPGQLRRLVRRALDELDPDLVRQAATRARAQRFVTRREGQIPGITEWWAHLRSEDSAACWAAIEALAATMKAEDPTRGIDQCRADALVDLILGHAQITTTLNIALPITCLTPDTDPGTSDPTDPGTSDPTDPGTSTSTSTRTSTSTSTSATDTTDTTETTSETSPAGDEAHETNEAGETADETTETSATAVEATEARNAPECLQPTGTTRWPTGPGGCVVPGIGVIPAHALHTLLGRFDTRITRMLVDADTGVTTETSSTAYRPPDRMRAYVQARDGTCRFPGCRVPARRCQLDHVIPWPHGQTTPTNLISLCAHHHRLKTHTRWRPHLHPDGRVTWTDPYGQTYQTHPTDHLQTHVA